VSEPWQTIATLVVGVGTGVVSAMFGVGGAVVSTPAIRLLGVSALSAVGTTLPCILPSAVAGSLRYAGQGLVDWPTVARAAPAGAVAAVAGSRLSRSVPGEGHLLMLATAGLLAFNASRMARRARPAGDPEARPALETTVPAGSRSQDRPAGRGWPTVLSGAAAGCLSGLLGVGGGVLLVPAFSEWLGLPIKVTVATSLVCVGIFALPGTLTHTLLGGIDWSYALPLSIGVVPGARLGSRLAVRASDRNLRLAVATALGAVSVIYAGAELAALLV
jgi:uncharacterized membrane protein YfcA